MSLTITKKLSKSINYHLCRCHQIRCLMSVNGQWTKVGDDNSEMPSLLKQIEVHWKPMIDKYWNNVLHEGKSKKVSRYLLSMFPYPSGSLHLGHIRIYTTSDVLSRLSHMRGHTIVHPMGFDSFGLPAENAAIQNSINPNEWTHSNISHMKRQLNGVSYQFNWRESTSDPSYYKWTQWLFLQLYKADLIYRGMGFVNWDPVDCTVLADEQVNDHGISWRSGAVVEKRCHRQWFVKTNSLANDLYLGNDVDFNRGHWHDIILHQRAWIGTPNGYLFYLKFDNNDDVIQIFTRYPEMFANDKAFIAISDRHWLSKSDQITNIKVVNPFTDKAMDIRIVNNDNIPMSTEATIMVMRESFEDINIRNNILNACRELKVGGYYTSDKYRDWLISRQRYWGTPIPIVYCNNCGVQTVPEDQLPVELPQLTDWDALRNFKSEDISNPIKKLAPKEWLYTKCPNCESDAMRETETCDTFFDSSWYFLRFGSKPLDNAPFDASSAQQTWCYVGGKEHSSLHLFYARFITHFLYHQGLCPFREPFGSLLMQSIVKGKTYKVNNQYINANDVSKYKKVKVEYEKMSKSKGNGVDPDALIQKYGSDAMRWCILSEGNPESERLWSTDEKEFTPTLTFMRRVLITIEEFIDAKQQEKNDQIGTKCSNGITIKKISEEKKLKAIEELNYLRNEGIDKMLFHLEHTYLIRTAITGLHKLTSAMRRYSRTDVALTPEYERSLASLIIMMSPLTPHFSEECWYCFGSQANGQLEHYDISKTVMEQQWPKIDNSYHFYITFIDHNGKQKDDQKIQIERSSLKNWTEKEIKDLIDKHVPQKDIEKIIINRDVTIIVQLKNIQENDKNSKDIRSVM